MPGNTQEWLPLDQAAAHFGYSHPENLRQRLRQLRKRGQVTDIGRPPGYPVADRVGRHKVVIMWPNPQTALLRCDAPATLLNPKRGRRARLAK